jgi:hypothetical protein
MFVYNSVRRKKHNIHIYIKPDSDANTSVRPKDFMQCVTKFSSDHDFLKSLKKHFNSAVRNTQFCKLSDRMKEDQFDINVKYNGKVETGVVTSSTHLCVYNVVINKRRTASYYGYNIYIYFIPKDEIVSCVQNDNNFIVELQRADGISVGRIQKPVERRINEGQPLVNKLSKPVGPALPKGCQKMYKIEGEDPYFVATLDEASWLKDKKEITFKEVMVVSVLGKLFEVVGEARVEEIDMNDYVQNYIFKSKNDIPKNFKHQQYKVNKTETVYSNMLIDDAVEGVYDMVAVGKKAGMLAVVIHRSFLGDVRELIYTEDPNVMKDLKAKFMNRRKI